jgi:hypothetical protein
LPINFAAGYPSFDTVLRTYSGRSEKHGAARLLRTNGLLCFTKIIKTVRAERRVMFYENP